MEAAGLLAVGRLRGPRAAPSALDTRRHRLHLRARRDRNSILSIFTRADGRERVAVPLWDGILSAFGSIAIGFGAALLAMIPIFLAAVLTLGTLPSTAPGHPLLSLVEIVFYCAGGWFAWSRLRAARGMPFRPLTAADVRVAALSIAALLIVRAATVVQLVLTNQTKHVQSGFEHFSVATHVPALTAISVGLAVLGMVVLGPLVEEIVFRGLLFGALAPRLGVIGAAALTAILFGAAHGDLVLFPSLAALGFVAALSYAASGNLTVPLLVHVFNNTFASAILVAGSLAR
ncbi:MAG: family intrarane metalloprotease [Candidatus Eremiobacteraeota bacterium]|nr:family intrarane metalloprotease [Candidatus Eremiobacteraeota bacterium]